MAYRHRADWLEDVDDEDKLMRFSQHHLIDLYKKAMARVRFLEANAPEVTICSQCCTINSKSGEKESPVLQVKYLQKQLAMKEQEAKDNSEQVAIMLDSVKNKSISSLECSLQDPATFILIEKLSLDLDATKKKLDENQRKLNAYQFTSDKRRVLHEKKKELDQKVTSEYTARLECELAMRKNLAEDFKKSQTEMAQYLQNMEEVNESKQIALYLSKDQSKKSKVSVNDDKSNQPCKCTIRCEKRHRSLKKNHKSDRSQGKEKSG